MTDLGIDVAAIVARALEEDVGRNGDITTLSTVPRHLTARGHIVAREDGIIVCGLPVVAEVFHQLSPSVQVNVLVPDGTRCRSGQSVAEVTGPAHPLLTGERVALNFLQRLSGIATLTRRFVEACRGTKARIADTRKTTPGLRVLERYAVRVGGGVNHRFGLFDGILIKDNHILLAGGVGNAVRNALAHAGPLTAIEVEVDTLEQLVEALEAGATRILLDNMPPENIRQAVEITAGRAVLEASGGVRLETVRAIAETGVDFISVGALTHSAPSVDFSFDIDPSSTGGTAPHKS